MNALQVQFREEVYRTAAYRGFHFDSVKIASVGEFLSVQAWCGKRAAVLHIQFKSALDWRRRQHFRNALCDQIIDRDVVMSRAETIDRRNEGWVLHYIWGNGNPNYIPMVGDPLHE